MTNLFVDVLAKTPKSDFPEVGGSCNQLTNFLTEIAISMVRLELLKLLRNKSGQTMSVVAAIVFNAICTKAPETMLCHAQSCRMIERDGCIMVMTNSV